MPESDTGKFTREDDNTVIHEYTLWRRVKMDSMWSRAEDIMDALDGMPKKKTIDDISDGTDNYTVAQGKYVVLESVRYSD